MIRNAENSAPPPSIGYPLYSYPDQDTCDMYSGVACTNYPDLCCYNEAKWCPNGVGSADCVLDNGAYPFGDLPMIPAEMTDPLGLTPFPNAILWNWATIFILGFGNIAALDFQARCMASKNARTATIGCLVAGVLTFFIGIPFSYLGAITRTYYGPDTARAEFITDVSSNRVLRKRFLLLCRHETHIFLSCHRLVLPFLHFLPVLCGLQMQVLSSSFLLMKLLPSLEHGVWLVLSQQVCQPVMEPF